MKKYLKKMIKKLLLKTNYRVTYCQKGLITGINLREDLKLLIKKPEPVCFDIGANRGQTIKLFQSTFASPRIYSFEPSTEIFQELMSEDFGGRVSLFNFALGDRNSKKEFINYEDSELSSFLKLDERWRSWLEMQGRYSNTKQKGVETVEIKTLDWFIEKHNIQRIDLLKIDTQGYDLQVLKGAEKSLTKGIAENVMVELNFVRKYINQSDLYQISAFLDSCNISLVDYYEKFRQNNRLEWCTALYTLT